MTTGLELVDETPLDSDEHWDFDNGLRILFIPMISASNMMEASPTYNRFKQADRWMQEHYDFPVYWHILWPATDADEMRYRYKWVNKEERVFLNTKENVELIKCRHHATQSTDLGMSSAAMREIMNVSEGNRFYDVVWNQKAGVTAELMDQIAPRREGDAALPPLVNTLQMPPIRKKTFNDWSRLRFASGLVGPNCHTVWESDHEIERTMGELREYFNPTTIKSFKDRSSVVEPGIDVDWIDEVTEGVERQKDPPIITFNGKIYNDRDYDEAWRAMDTLYTYGDVELQIVTPGLSGTAASTESEYSGNIDHFNKYIGLPKEEYLRQSRKASIMVNSVKWTDFNQTMGEVVATGVLPVVRRGNWSELLFGKDYPFLYGGEQHAKKMLIHVYKNLDEYYNEWVPKLQKRLRNRFHSARYFKEILDQFNRLRNEYTWGDEWFDLPKYHDRHSESNRRKKAMVQALKHTEDVFTMQDFADSYKRITDSGKDILRAFDGRSPAPHLRYYYAFKKRGIIDRCDGPEPVLDKTHIEDL